MYEGIGRNVATMAKMKTNLPERPVMATCKHIHLILDLVSCSLAFSSPVVGGIIGFMVIIY